MLAVSIPVGDGDVKRWWFSKHVAAPLAAPEPLTWRAAEHLAAESMRSMGFKNVEVTPASSDGGVDLTATNAVAQVKMHAAAVQRPDVQKLRGAAFRVPNALFFSFSGYSSGAIVYADQNSVALFNIVRNSPVAVNEVARAMMIDQRRATVADGRVSVARRTAKVGGPVVRSGVRGASTGGRRLALSTGPVIVGLGRTLRSAAPRLRQQWMVTIPIGAGLLASSIFYGIAKESSGPWKNDRSPGWVTLTGIAVWVIVGLLTWLAVRRVRPRSTPDVSFPGEPLDVPSPTVRREDIGREAAPDGG